MDITTNFSHNHIINMVAYKGQNKTESSFLNKIEPHFLKKKKFLRNEISIYGGQWGPTSIENKNVIFEIKQNLSFEINQNLNLKVQTKAQTMSISKWNIEINTISSALK